MGAHAFVGGRLGSDPESKDVGDKKVCNFSVATTRRVKGEEVTDWHNLTAWNGAAEVICKYMKKGEYHEFTGDLIQNKYTDKDGNPRVKTEIKVQTFNFGPNPKKEEAPF